MKSTLAWLDAIIEGRTTDWTGMPLGHWFIRAGKPITTESLWAEELGR